MSEQPVFNRGPWIQTYSGARWFVADPRPEEVPLADVVHALSNMCRFGGHCRVFYSVLEHSVRVARELISRCEDHTNGLYLHGAWHDASEGLLVDVPRPLKGLMPDYKRYEKATQEAIIAALKLPPLSQADHHWLKKVDDVLLVTEQRDLMMPCQFAWDIDAQPLVNSIEPWTPKDAVQEFLLLLQELEALPDELIDLC